MFNIKKDRVWPFIYSNQVLTLGAVALFLTAVFLTTKLLDIKLYNEKETHVVFFNFIVSLFALSIFYNKHAEIRKLHSCSLLPGYQQNLLKRILSVSFGFLVIQSVLLYVNGCFNFIIPVVTFTCISGGMFIVLSRNGNNGYRIIGAVSYGLLGGVFFPGAFMGDETISKQVSNYLSLFIILGVIYFIIFLIGLRRLSLKNREGNVLDFFLEIFDKYLCFGNLRSNSPSFSAVLFPALTGLKGVFLNLVLGGLLLAIALDDSSGFGVVYVYTVFIVIIQSAIFYKAQIFQKVYFLCRSGREKLSKKIFGAYFLAELQRFTTIVAMFLIYFLFFELKLVFSLKVLLLSFLISWFYLCLTFLLQIRLPKFWLLSGLVVFIYLGFIMVASLSAEFIIANWSLFLITAIPLLLIISFFSVKRFSRTEFDHGRLFN